MKAEGLDQVAHVVSGIMKKNNSVLTPAQRAQKMAEILHVCTSCGLAGIRKREELKDVDMIDSNQINDGFVPPYAQVDANIDIGVFMSQAERQRAQTYYQQVKQEAAERTCKFCDRQITPEEEKNGNKTFLQSSECFHQVHIDCLKDNAIKLMSDDKKVCCPRCHQTLHTFELKEYLDKNEQ
jgi:hypothetical protein